MPAPAIGRRARWSPGPNARIDWSHPRAAGLVMCFIPSISTRLDLCGIPWTDDGGNTFGAGPNGREIQQLSPVTDGGFSTTKLDTLPASVGSVALGYRKLDSTARISSGFGIKSTDDTNRLGAHFPYSDGTAYFDYGGAGGANRVSVGGLTYTGEQHWCLQSTTAALEIYQNGRRVAVGSGPATRTVAGATSLRLFGGNNGTTAIDTDVAAMSYFYVYNRELSAHGVAELYADPFCFLRS